jgi:hypothetical protein
VNLDAVEEALRAMSLPVRRRASRLRAACPICARGGYRRRDQALSAAEGDRRPLLLYCFRCQSTFQELLAALGVDDERARQFCQFTSPRRRASRDDNGRRPADQLEGAWARSVGSLRRTRALAHAARVLLADADDLARLGTGEADGRLVFAVRDDNGVLVGLERYAMPGSRARAGVESGAPKLLAQAGSRRSWWPAPGDVRLGEHLGDVAVVCEGAPAAVTLAGCGFSAIAFPSAIGLSDGDAARIARHFSRAVVLADADDAGRGAASASASLLREHAVAAVMVDLFPGVNDHRDVGDVLRARVAHASLTAGTAGAWLASRLEGCLGGA